MTYESTGSPAERNDVFPHTLVPSDLSYTLSYIEGRRDKVVRKEPASRLTTSLGISDIHAAVKRSDELFQELEGKGVAVVSKERFIEETGKEAVVYTISQKLDGNDLVTLIFDDPESDMDKIDTFLSSLLRYIGEKYISKEEYLSDIYDGAQYVYGKGDANEPRVYLVALDTKVGRFLVDDANTDFFRCVEGIFQMILTAEKKLGQKALTNARASFTNVVNALPQDDRNKDKLLPLLAWFS